MHSLKYTIYNSYDEESNMPLLASVHLLKSYDPKIKEEIGINISKYTYFVNKENFETKDIIKNSKENDINKIFEKLKKIKLNELKNNYYTDKEEERKKHWELEYDMFKKVGTFDNIPKEIKEIEKIIKFNEFIEDCRKEEVYE